MRLGRLGLAIAALLCSACAASDRPAAPPVVPLGHLPALAGDYFPIASARTGRPYHIYVRLPADYAAAPDARYPVVYVTDGDSLFPILAPSHLFLTYDDGLPDAIIVGIAYGSFDPAINRRDVDFAEATPGAADGAAAFQAFLREELIPRVEQRYRADPARRILVGQSRGGALVLYSAFTDPDLFWARIASNPSFEPGRARFFGRPSPAARSDLRLAVISGTRDRARSRDPAISWFREMEGRADLPWALHSVHLEDGTHAADIARAYRGAMRWIFARPAN